MVRLFSSSKSKKGDDPKAIDNAFNIVLDESGVPESERKTLMQLDPVRKQQLIQSYQSKAISKKDYAKSNSKSVSHSPQYFAEGLKTDPSKELLTSLRVRLGNQPLKWLKEFIAINGVMLLLQVLNANEIKPAKTPDEYYKIAQCLNSLKLIMNNRVGLEAVIKMQNGMNSIALILDTAHLKTKIMVSELLAALCVLHAKGHAMVLSAMDHYRQVKREKKPYIHLIQGLKNPSASLQAVTFALVNTLISSAKNVEDRIKVRNQFKRIGLVKMIEELEADCKSNPDLATQRDLYEQEARWDEQEYIENARGDQTEDNPDTLFRNIKERTTGGPLYPAFLSIMNHLLKTASDEDSTDEQSLSNYLFVEKILTKINGGTVPSDDFAGFFGETTGGSGTDISHVSGEKAVLIQKEIEDLKKKEKRAAEKLHEKDILLTKLAKKIKRLEDGIKNGTGKEVLEAEEELEAELIKIAAVETKKPNNLKSGSKDDEDSKSGGFNETFMRARAPTEGVTDFLSGLNGEISDSAAPTDGPPLPPGVPPPPPPPGAKIPQTPERCLRPPAVKMKSYQWAKYRTRNIPNTFWTKVNFEKYNESLPYEHIESLFAAAVIERKEREQKKGDVTVIDPKRAQNIGILLSRFKGTSNDAVFDAITNLDEKVLDLETINQLIKYIPSKEEIDAIKAFKVSQEAKPEEERLNLGKAEQFIDKISTIPRLTQRIQALHFKLNFPEKLYQAKPDIRIFNEAMNDLQTPRFYSVLELILSLGNFINHGTIRGNASGFKVDSINKMADTKSNSRDKYNLVHYLVELMERIQPNLIDFYEDLPNVIEAATLSFSTSANEIRMLKSGLAKIEKEIFGGGDKPVKEEKDGEGEGEEGEEGEKKEPVKPEEFLLSAKTELVDAETLLGETEILYVKLAKFFGEDTNRPVEEFCAIFKRFSDTYQLARKDLEREKAMAERASKRKTDKQQQKEVEKKKSSKFDFSKVKLKSGSKRSEENSPGGSQGSAGEDEDEEAIKEYINSIRSTDSPTGSNISSEGEGMMDDVLNLIRDGDFRTIRKNHLAGKIRPPKPKPKQLVRDVSPATNTYSSTSSKYDAEPLEVSDSEQSDFSDDDDEEDDDDETGETGETGETEGTEETEETYDEDDEDDDEEEED
eukprot:gene17416-20781_t